MIIGVDDDNCVLYMYTYIRLWWRWWNSNSRRRKRRRRRRGRRRRDYDDSSRTCLNCWLLNFVLVRISCCWSLVLVLVVDRWWWWCWRHRFFSSSSLSIICAVGLRLLLWFVVWKIERDKDPAKKRKNRKKERNCWKKETEREKRKCVWLSHRKW